MRSALNWFVVGLSVALLGLNYSLASRTPVPAPDYLPVAEAKFVPFEAAGRSVTPAALRRERNLEFGYVTLDGTPQKAAATQLLN